MDRPSQAFPSMPLTPRKPKVLRSFPDVDHTINSIVALGHIKPPPRMRATVEEICVGLALNKDSSVLSSRAEGDLRLFVD